MRVKMVVEKKGKICEIPISIKMLRDIYDLSLMCVDDEDITKNVDVSKIVKKFAFLIHDVIDDGKVYSLDEKGRWKEERMFIIKKPKWRKVRGNETQSCTPDESNYLPPPPSKTKMEEIE